MTMRPGYARPGRMRPGIPYSEGLPTEVFDSDDATVAVDQAIVTELADGLDVAIAIDVATLHEDLIPTDSAIAVDDAVVTELADGLDTVIAFESATLSEFPRPRSPFHGAVERRAYGVALSRVPGPGASVRRAGKRARIE